MYVIFIKHHIHHLFNESKIKFFAYKSDQTMYMTYDKDHIYY